MQQSTTQVFQILIAALDTAGDIQVTTTIRKLIKEHERIFGFRPSLRKTKRAVDELIEEGYFDWLPPPPCRRLISPYNRPFVLTPGKVTPIRPPPPGRPGAPPRGDLASLNLDKKDTAIIACLLGIAKKFGKNYCYPSQATIIKNCRDYGDEDMALSTLNRHLNQLEAAGMFKRVHRHRQKSDGTWEYRSTIYILCARLWSWVRKGLAMFSKAASFLGVPKMGINPLTQGDLSNRGPSQNGASPPGLKEKGAASPSVSVRGPSGLAPFNFEGLTTSFRRQ